MLRNAFAALIIIVQGVASGCSVLPSTHGPVMAVSVSSSGDYAISSHRDNVLVLWNLEDRQSSVLAENANIYSARFVRGRPAFIWQDLDNVVHVETVDGKQLRAFKHFPTYGHVMTRDLGTYLSVDDEWNVYSGYGDDLQPVLSDGISPSFVGTGKLLNLSLSTEKGRFLTAGSGSDEGRIEDYPPLSEERRFSRYGGVNLWGLSEFEPKARMSGFAAKTYATLSPDGEWAVGGDENGNLLYWNTSDPDARHIAAVDGLGVPTMKRSGQGYSVVDSWNDEQLIPVPEGLEIHRPILQVSFIHGSEYYLRFNNDSDAAALFKAGNPWPQKYFDLGDDPRLVTYGSHYSRNTAIATSPEAGVLVMGHDEGGGISVYQYDSEQQTLERTWVVD